MTKAKSTPKPMTRKGKTLKALRDGHPRRMSDGRNAWRKMSPEQRRVFVDWMEEEGLEVTGRPARQTPYVDAFSPMGEAQ